MVKEEESYAAVERNTSGSRPKELFLVSESRHGCDCDGRCRNGALPGQMGLIAVWNSSW